MGQAYDVGLGDEMDGAQAEARLRRLVEGWYTARVRALVREDGVRGSRARVEVSRTAGGVESHTLSAEQAAPILKAIEGLAGSLADDNALSLDDGLVDLEAPGYDGEPFARLASEPPSAPVGDRQRGAPRTRRRSPTSRRSPQRSRSARSIT